MEPLSCKQLAATWDIPVTKTSQAWNPFEAKLGALAIDHPDEFPLMLYRAIQRVRAEREAAEQARLESELPRRLAMLEGRANSPRSTSATHPTS